MQIKTSEITEILKRQLQGYEKAIDVAEVGSIISIGDGIARVHGIDALFALAEERLARYYNGVGITNQRIGDAIELHGQRFPVILSPTGIINNLSEEYRSLYRTIAAEIAQPR